MLNFFYLNLYHSFAFAYEFVALLVSTGEWFMWVKQILKYVDDEGTILEIGFGTGVLYQELAKLGHKIIGIDESKNMINIAKSKLKSNNLLQQITRANAKNLPFSNNTFNLVLTTFPSGYIFEPVFHEELERVLAINGQFVALLGVKFSNVNFIDFIYRILFKFSQQSVDVESIENSFKYPKYKDRFDIAIDTVNYKKRQLIFLRFRKL